MRCKFVPKQGRYHGRCCRTATEGRADGLCNVHRKLAARDTPEFRARQAALLRLRRGAAVPKAPCSACSAPTPEPRLKAGVCSACRRMRAAERDSAAAVPRDSELCSVAGCDSPRAYGRTCFRHAVRFDKPLLAPRPSAIHFALQRTNPMENA